MPNIFFDRSNDAGSGARFDRTNDASAGFVFASGPGATDQSVAANASGIGYALVTMQGPFDVNDSHSIFFQFQGTPQNGDVVRYPTTNGLVVDADGKSRANTNDFTWTLYYNDGTGEQAFTVTYVPWVIAAAPGATSTAQAAQASASGAGLVNANAPGVTDAATPAAASAKGDAAASGAGVTDSSSAANAGAKGGAQANGEGITDTTSAADATATGGSPGNASAPGATDTTSAATASAKGDALASGAGVTDSSSAATADAKGAAQASGAGTTDTSTAADASAGGGAKAQGAGATDTTSAADAGAVGGARANGAGAESTTQAAEAVSDSGIEVALASGAGAKSVAADVAGAGAAIAAGAAAQSVSKASGGDALSIPDAVYARRIDMIKRFGIDELRQLTDKSDTGDIDDSVLSQALLDADAEIDGYLQGRYALPLASVPRVLTTYSCDIARYRLYDDRASEQVEKRYDTAVKFLRMVAEGKMALGVSPVIAPISTSAGPQASSGDRVFTMDSLKDFNA